MTTLKIKIVDCQTGEEIMRDMTEEELNQVELDRLNAIERRRIEKIEAESKAKAKAVLLDKLGITEEEARLLLG